MEIIEIALKFVREWQESYFIVDGKDVNFTVNTAPYYVALGSADELNLKFYQLELKQVSRKVVHYKPIDGKSRTLLIEWR